jgi:hypothetical protein
VKAILKPAGRAAGGTLSVAALTQLSMPELAAVGLLVVLVLGVICWIISSDERSARVSRMMLARRGDAKCLETSASPPSPPKARARRQSTPPGSGTKATAE